MSQPDKYAYPAIFSYQSGCEIAVELPDLGVATSGVNETDAVSSARELLSCVICGLKEDGEEIPQPTPLDALTLHNNEHAVLIVV